MYLRFRDCSPRPDGGLDPRPGRLLLCDWDKAEGPLGGLKGGASAESAGEGRRVGAEGGGAAGFGWGRKDFDFTALRTSSMKGPVSMTIS